ncbi:hypothetical protein [Paenibacillus donghaensis]|uniref:Uncharacterized protein n=1 Tax=Paenibacillus donghaensis TaxID=414771 RepID=A0A2Z2KGM1_9BACL|nr:hypothetical protein [Paenibacillus donghaensis]ASA23185.1 hypothetical protein B9T62_21685 [Paenibacillus donghaensis]
MKTTLFAREITYAKEDVAELETASLKVQLIYDKVLHMLHIYLPPSLWDAWIGVPYSVISSLYKGDHSDGTVFQKWIHGPYGWKNIGCERHCLESEEQGELMAGGLIGERRFKFHNGIRQSMVLQAVIWSLYENSLRLGPLLGGELFFEPDELEDISNYFVPTFLNPSALLERSRPYKEYREHNLVICQEWISAPDVVLQWEGGLTEGRWMTGVYMDEFRFGGLSPYLKDSQGKRTYMQACVQ